MRFEILVQNPHDLNDLTGIKSNFKQIGIFQYEVENNIYTLLDIPYLDAGFHSMNTKLMFLAFDGKTAVGALCLEYVKDGWNGDRKCCWSMMSIGVHSDYENQGYSTGMIHAMFSTMNELGLSGLCQSSYTDEGAERIKKIFNRYSEIFPNVGFIDTDRIF